MTLTKLLTTTTALTLTLSGAAFADLTAEQVLADQLSQMALSGMEAEVIGQERNGDVLTVEGLRATATFPEGAMNMTLGGATFTEMGDGTVKITYPASIPMTMDIALPDEEAMEISMSLNQTGTEMIASGTPEQLRYDFVSESFSFADLQFSGPDEMDDIEMEVQMNMGGLSGFVELAGGTVRNYVADFAIDSLVGIISAEPPEGGSFSVDISIADMVSAYEGAIAPQDFGASFAKAVQDGNKTKGAFTHGAANYVIKVDSPDGAFDMAAAIASGTLDFTLDDTGLSYGGTNTQTTFSFATNTMPLPPMTITMAESGGRFAMPIIPSEDAQDFGFRMSLVDLVVDPILWSMIDPGEQLPRDPATLIVDLDGEAVLEQDIFDPAYAEQAVPQAPGQLNALNLNELRLTIAGAELTGDGDFTFENSGPVPVPTGVANIMLTGSNQLMDTLVSMGLLPEQQAMGARMMMGLFARPGEGPDALVSTIEMKEDGSILANGQRIK